ncbi:MAG TPA: hypothetical protein EYM27_07280 [Dehalococcoidia bacterium]|nr:hypothetical protein [Dehalococcoidia bacterium]
MARVIWTVDVWSTEAPAANGPRDTWAVSVSVASDGSMVKSSESETTYSKSTPDVTGPMLSVENVKVRSSLSPGMPTLSSE